MHNGSNSPVIVNKRKANSIDEFGEYVKGASLQATQISKGKCEADLGRVIVDRGVLDYGSFSNTILSEGTYSPDRITMGMILGTKINGIFNGFKVGTGDFAIIKENAGVIYKIEADTQWMSMQMQRSDLELLGMNHSDHEINVYQTRNASLNHFNDTIRTLIATLQHSNKETLSYIGTNMLYNHLIAETAYVISENHNSMCLGRNDYLKYAKIISQYLYDNPTDIIQINNLCRVTGIKIHTLERVCHRAFDMPPKTLIKLHRLNAIHKVLKNSTLQTVNIARLAMEHGFLHVGRFAGEYKKLFGQSPSQTLRKLRYEI